MAKRLFVSSTLKFSKPSGEVSRGEVKNRAGGCGKDSGESRSLNFFFKSLLHFWHNQAVADSPQPCSNQGIFCIEMAE